MKTLQTIRGRYTLIFGGLAIFFIVTATATNQLVSYLETTTEKFTPAISAILNADRDLHQARLAEAGALGNGNNPNAFKALKAAVEENGEQAYMRMQGFMAMTKGVPEIEAVLVPFDRLFQSWKAASEKVLALASQGRTDEAIQAYVGSSKESFAQLRGLYDASGELVNKYSAEEKELAGKYVAKFKLTLFILVALVIALSLGLAWFAPRNISTAIRKVTTGIEEIHSGDGDLTRRIDHHGKGEIGELSAQFNRFLEGLGHLIRGVRDQSNAASGQMDELHATAQRSDEVSQNQSQLLEFVVSAVDEMNAAVKEVAQNALNTVEEMVQVDELTKSGQETLSISVEQIQTLSSKVSSAAEVIKKLSETSSRIVSILDSIQGIAEQTNLLALNAAIEAARAGEQGRGFAVVADEVRNLASKTQRSTEDIQDMILELQSDVREAVETVESGVEVARAAVEQTVQAQEALGSILEATTNVRGMSMQTATATEEQSQVAEEINANLVKLSELNRDVLEMSSRMNDIVRHTRTSSGLLSEQVGHFKV